MALQTKKFIDCKMPQRWWVVATPRPYLMWNSKVQLYADCSILTGLEQMSLFKPNMLKMVVSSCESGRFFFFFLLLVFKWHHWTLLTASALEYLIWLAVMYRSSILADVIRLCVYRTCLCNSSSGTTGNDVILNARHSCWNCAAATFYEMYSAQHSEYDSAI